MQELSYSIPGVNEEIDACREMAFDAIVDLTYFVSEPLALAAANAHISRSLATAYELWSKAPWRQLSITFNWSVGDESGSGIIRYDAESCGPVRLSYVQRQLRDMVVSEISERLFERIPRSEKVETIAVAA
jgi:hypothetical protein